MTFLLLLLLLLFFGAIFCYCYFWLFLCFVCVVFVCVIFQLVLLFLITSLLFLMLLVGVYCSRHAFLSVFVAIFGFLQLRHNCWFYEIFLCWGLLVFFYVICGVLSVDFLWQL